MQVLDDAGYTSVLGTNCDQTYARTLKPGEVPSISTHLADVKTLECSSCTNCVSAVPCPE